jgi:hypothetical protein
MPTNRLANLGYNHFQRVSRESFCHSYCSTNLFILGRNHILCYSSSIKIYLHCRNHARTRLNRYYVNIRSMHFKHNNKPTPLTTLQTALTALEAAPAFTAARNWQGWHISDRMPDMVTWSQSSAYVYWVPLRKTCFYSEKATKSNLALVYL